MAGKPREPIDLIMAKGKKHLTKNEIEKRKNTEVNVEDYKNVKPPSYLTKSQQKDFVEIATKLVSIGIMSELDEDCLARYLIAKEEYLNFTKLLNSALKNKQKPIYKENIEMQKMYSLEIESNLINQDRAFKQCQSSARELGLTISSRCKLIVPNPVKEEKENKFGRFLA